MEAGTNGAVTEPRPKLPQYVGKLRVEAARIEHLEIPAKEDAYVKLTLSVPDGPGTMFFAASMDWYRKACLIAEGVHGVPVLTGGFLVRYEDGSDGWWSAPKFEASFGPAAEAPPQVPAPKPTQASLLEQLRALIEEDERNPALSCEANRQMIVFLDGVGKRLFARDAQREARVGAG